MDQVTCHEQKHSNEVGVQVFLYIYLFYFVHSDFRTAP